MTDIEEGNYKSTNIVAENDKTNYDSTNTTEAELEDKFCDYTLEGNWHEVEKLYKSDVKFCTIDINKSRGTALHVAVNEGNINAVSTLVGIILHHKKVEAFKQKNDKGDSPLHLAASRGLKEICECIIGKHGERKDLIYVANYNGETPLFLASLSWEKQTFCYLFSFYPIDNKEKEIFFSKDFTRSNGDTILHCAIQREFFDLALIIIHKYPLLGGIPNNEGYTPLKLLATRPSAFESGCKMMSWKKILYYCIPVKNLNVKEDEAFYVENDMSEPKHPKNYDTCCLFRHKCLECARLLLGIIKPPVNTNSPNNNSTTSHASDNKEKKQQVVPDQQQNNISMPYDLWFLKDRELLPENYATCLWFLKFVYISILGLCGVEVHEIKKMKQKHKWCSQLLTIFMKKARDSYFGVGGKPLLNVSEPNIQEILKVKSEDAKKSETLKSEQENGDEVLKSETPILTAARHGIVEMVNVFINKIPSSIYETNLKNKNILLVAVENRRTIVVESLKKRFEKPNTKPLFDNLIQWVDNENNTVLHLAATPSEEDWNISGPALQIMWDIKWFQYAKGLVPEHFRVRTNKKNKTAREIFKEKHKKLVESGAQWLKDTSESCSVVAALLAGVSFATSSTIPGGNKSESGEPALEGKPAFDAFALSSIIGLCFSVTALIMFLSILTSRKEAKDFRIDLPRKLLLGLTSLFLSIVALFTAFCSGHFFLIDQKYKKIMYLIYSATCFPVTLYAASQLPLYIDILKGIVTKIPITGAKDEDL